MEAENIEVRAQLNLLGPMRLRRDGTDVTLPSSRKTRALLAFLAVTGRPVRRDYLCELFWEVPDDPRGALRWSLSKLRGILDSPGCERLFADRDTVGLHTGTIQSDWHLLRAIISDDVATVSIDRLRAAASTSNDFLEGLELPRCEEFQAWCIAHREDVRRWRCAIFGALAASKIDPEEALGFAREWVRLDPFEPGARISLLRLLEAAGRRDEIPRQRELALSKLKEAGASVPAELRAAKTTEPAIVAEVFPLPEQHVRFCTASDNTGLAWSIVGQGRPLVKTANWLNHLEYDWDSPVWRHWITILMQDHSLVRYDERGNGLSDWNAANISFDAFVDDLESVVDAAGLEKFDLLGVSQGASVSIAYAVRHPERVRRLVLYGGYAMGWRVRQLPGELERRNAMATLIREGWGQNNPAFRQMFTTLFFPDATPFEMDWFNELQRMTTSPQNAERLQNAFADIDVRSLLPQVKVPTLVLHVDDDAVIPFSAGRSMAAAIPDARFVALEGRNHLMLETERAWSRFVTSVCDFLAEED